MKAKLSILFLVICLALSVLAACGGETPEPPQKLEAPVITLTDNVATWQADANADKFEISLDGTLSYVENTVASRTLEDGQTIKVRAVGDGVSYSTSEWSNSVTYTASTPAPQPTKLGTPTVTISNTGLASWTAVANASSYVYKINGGAETPTTATSVQLTDGQTIVVRAVGDGTNYTDSDYSASQTYTAGAPAPQPTKLGTPNVTISNTGLASWTAVANASSYVYKINGGAETPTAATSVQLTDGQTIVVKAIGDGTTYLDSDWSGGITYTATTPGPDPVPQDAPEYIGIFASASEPSASQGLPEGIKLASGKRLPRAKLFGAYMDFATVIGGYLTSSDNYLGDSYPKESDFDIYARAGQVVYIQIWLNNPSQHTILSLELNGTKYQVGGGLFSFFVENGGKHYNCVYVAVTIPNDSYYTISYEVSKIEYVEGSNVNQDGKSVLIDEENDTVTVGLPYNAQNPAISDFNPTSLTINSCSATLNVSDASGLLNLSGGWLGIAVYDGQNIIANQGLVIGNNSVSATGLVENTDYWITVYLYADLHDGRGVSAHILFERHIRTLEAITVNEVSGTLLYNSEKDGYYGAIKVNTTLNSTTAEYIKLEILKDNEVVYTDTNYNGAATISEGILCGSSYSVRVYYKDTEYPEGKYVEENAWINYLGTPWYQEAGVYTFVNDAVHYFQLGNGDNNYPAIDSFTLKLYKEESARWVASDVLYILEHPTAINDLNARIDVLRDQFNAAYGNFELMDQIHDQMSALEEQLDPLEYAQWYIEYRADNNTDIAYWQSEAAKGKYFYTFEYNGANTDTLFKVGKTYYAVLDDALTYGIEGLDLEIDFKYDAMDGNGLCDGEINDQYINLDRELTNHWVEMENVRYSDGKLTLTLFNESDYWTGIRAPFAIGYVYKVEVGDKVLYLDESKHEFDIDEAAWFNEYIELIKAGESVDGLMEKYVPDYESSYTIPVDTTKLEAGHHNFYVSIRLIGTDYEDGECQATRCSDSITVYAQIEKPVIEYKELWGEYYGVVTPESIDGWNNDYYEYEAIDKNGNPVEITIASEAGYARFYVPPQGTKVRVRIPASEYWLESEWSEWVTFDGIPVSKAEFGEYDKSTCTISWSANTENVSHYLYTINDGAPVRVELDGEMSVALDNGDVLRVKCVASEEGLAKGYLDSEWVEYTCIDLRQKLDTPTNVRVENGTLLWDEVAGASRYVIEWNYNGTFTSEVDYIGYPGKIGTTYRIRAISDNTESYKPSDWSEAYLFTTTLENPQFDRIYRERVYWTSVDYAQGYNYKIGKSGEVNTVRSYYIALSDIPTGEELYVQAYATGCTSSEWVLIYTAE